MFLDILNSKRAHSKNVNKRKTEKSLCQKLVNEHEKIIISLGQKTDLNYILTVTNETGKTMRTARPMHCRRTRNCHFLDGELHEKP